MVSLNYRTCDSLDLMAFSKGSWRGSMQCWQKKTSQCRQKKTSRGGTKKVVLITLIVTLKGTLTSVGPRQGMGLNDTEPAGNLQGAFNEVSDTA